MAVTLSWDDAEHTILRYDFTGRWTWDEFHDVLVQVVKILDQAPAEINMIADLSQSAGIPLNLLPNIKRVAEMAHPRAGLTVYVGTGGLLRAFGEMFTKIYPSAAAKYKFDFARTLDDARQILRQRQSQRKTD
jgi:hypothetical protein